MSLCVLPAVELYLLPRAQQRWSTLLVPLLATGCRTTQPAAVEFLPFGSRSDVASAIGEYPGYTLAVDCGDTTRGRGNLTIVGQEARQPADSAEIKQLKDEIVFPATRDIDFAVGVGYGRVCGGDGIVVTLSSWKVVDKTLARLGLLVGSLSARVNIELRVVPPGSK